MILILVNNSICERNEELILFQIFRDFYIRNIFCFADNICWVPLRSTQPTGDGDHTEAEISQIIQEIRNTVTNRRSFLNILNNCW